MTAAINNVTNTTNTTNTTGTSSASNSNTTASAQKGLNNDYDQFLKLLTTQLTNQDPTAPLDTNQITQQIAQLSQVQQSINTNTKLDQLISIYNGTQANAAVSYIGKQVDAIGNQVDLSNSQATLVYNLPNGATTSTVTIKDSTGATVFTGPGTTVSGRNQLLWKGTDTSGNKVPDGTYTFSVAAQDANKKDVTATAFTTGIVTAVLTQNGENKLSLGQISVPLSSVQSVYTSGTNPGA